MTSLAHDLPQGCRKQKHRQPLAASTSDRVSSSQSGTLKHLFPGKRGGASLRSVNHKHTPPYGGWLRPLRWDGRGAQGLPHGPQKVPPKPAAEAGRGAQSPRRTRARGNWGHLGSPRVSRAAVIHSRRPERPSRRERGFAAGASGSDAER